MTLFYVVYVLKKKKNNPHGFRFHPKLFIPSSENLEHRSRTAVSYLPVCVMQPGATSNTTSLHLVDLDQGFLFKIVLTNCLAWHVTDNFEKPFTTVMINRCKWNVHVFHVWHMKEIPQNWFLLALPCAVDVLVKVKCTVPTALREIEIIHFDILSVLWKIASTLYLGEWTKLVLFLPTECVFRHFPSPSNL